MSCHPPWSVTEIQSSQVIFRVSCSNFKLQETTLDVSSAYHPLSDGQAEVVNKSVEHFLRCYGDEKPKQWSTWLPMAEYW